MASKRLSGAPNRDNLGGGKFWHPERQNVDVTTGATIGWSCNRRFISIQRFFHNLETLPNRLRVGFACLYQSHD